MPCFLNIHEKKQNGKTDNACFSNFRFCAQMKNKKNQIIDSFVSSRSYICICHNCMDHKRKAHWTRSQLTRGETADEDKVDMTQTWPWS